MTAIDFSLRDTCESDLPALFAIQADSAGQQMAAFTNTSNDLEKYLAKWRGLLADDTVVTQTIEVDGEVVGSVGSWDNEGDREVTYWIRRDFWGRGLATRALAAFLEIVTVRPIYGHTAYDNLGSQRVLEHNGFVRVGELESFAEARGGTIAEFVFELK